MKKIRTLLIVVFLIPILYFFVALFIDNKQYRVAPDSSCLTKENFEYIYETVKGGAKLDYRKGWNITIDQETGFLYLHVNYFDLDPETIIITPDLVFSLAFTKQDSPKFILWAQNTYCDVLESLKNSTLEL